MSSHGNTTPVGHNNWNCSCNYLNWDYRDTCRQCGKPRSSTAKNGSGNRGGKVWGRGGRGGNYVKGGRVEKSGGRGGGQHGQREKGIAEAWEHLLVSEGAEVPEDISDKWYVYDFLQEKEKEFEAAVEQKEREIKKKLNEIEEKEDQINEKEREFKKFKKGIEEEIDIENREIRHIKWEIKQMKDRQFAGRQKKKDGLTPKEIGDAKRLALARDEYRQDGHEQLHQHNANTDQNDIDLDMNAMTVAQSDCEETEALANV